MIHHSHDVSATQDRQLHAPEGPVDLAAKHMPMVCKGGMQLTIQRLLYRRVGDALSKLELLARMLAYSSMMTSAEQCTHRFENPGVVHLYNL